ncbi:MAG: DUF1385 domain-containing protein [Clostridia bacterium]|nr:DUF1385 domain-containing protein [Clostridia bacterium]
MGKNKKEGASCRYLAAVGGQALMEGIMMNGPKGAAMALRMPDGSIEVTPKHPKRLRDKNKFFALPFIRGPIAFVENMVFGYQCLMESAEKTSFDPNEPQEEEMSKLDRWLTDHFGPKMMSVIGIISVILGFALSFGLFIALPSYIFKGVQYLTGLDYMWRPLVEGAVKIIIFVGYMAAVSQMKEMKRLFMYHGAEHKSIFCLEAGEALTVENVRRQKRFHPRCGTSFLFVTIILSILLAAVMSILLRNTVIVDKDHTILWVLLKLLLLPIIMSFGFEFIRYAGKHDNVFVSICAAPGLWMQRITTKEPTDDIIEVGIAALKAVLDEAPAAETGEAPADDAADDAAEAPADEPAQEPDEQPTTDAQ